MKRASQRNSWPLTRRLLRFGPMQFVVNDATCHVLVVGSSGSGKTTSVLRRFLRAYLANGFGGVLICTKPDDRPTVLKWMGETGRFSDAIIFAIGHKRFDILRYLTEHRNPAVKNRTNIVETLEKMLGPLLGSQGGKDSEEEFWKIARRNLLNHLLCVAMYSGERVTFVLLWKILKGAPEDMEAVLAGEWVYSELGRCLRLAESRTAGRSDANEVRKAREYFAEDFPKFPDRTRACVVAAIQGMLSCLMDPIAEELMGGLDFLPEDALENAKVIILDPPDNTVGRMITLGFKDQFQKAAMRRSAGPDDDSMQPAFLCVDEFASWITPAEAPFLAKARSSRVCCLCLTQNIPGLIAAVGGPTPRETVDAMCGNFNGAKVFLANTDPTTTEWCAAQIGKSLRFNVSTQTREQHPFGQQNFSVSQQRDFAIHPDEFQLLRTGGIQNNFEVDAVVLLGSKAVQATGRPWMKVVFTQKDASRQREISAWRSMGLVAWCGRLFGWVVRLCKPLLARDV